MQIKFTAEKHIDGENMTILNLLLTQSARCTIADLVANGHIHCDLDRIL
jgi:hypothetical protein